LVIVAPGHSIPAPAAAIAVAPGLLILLLLLPLLLKGTILVQSLRLLGQPQHYGTATGTHLHLPFLLMRAHTIRVGLLQLTPSVS
jgi:hypothetical protein